MAGFDVAVVGAGIVGASVASACAARGARVVLIDRGRPAGEASGAAAGMLAPFSESDTPGPFLDLARRSLALWPDFARASEEVGGGDCGLRLSGLLRVAVDDESLVEVGARVAWQAAQGVECRMVDAAAAAADEPALAGCAGAALYPQEGHVDSPATVALVTEAVRRLGGEVRVGAEVDGLGPGGLRLTSGETVTTAAVVLAAGAWAGDLAHSLGVVTPSIRPVRGQLLVLRGVAPPPRRVLFAGRRGYVVAKADGRVLVGATEEDAGFDRSTTDAARERLLGTAARLLRGAAGATVDAAWAGLRPRTADALPVLGDAGTVHGVRVVMAAGHYRNGVLLAPATADGIAALLLDGVEPDGWAAFSPHRVVPA